MLKESTSLRANSMQVPPFSLFRQPSFLFYIWLFVSLYLKAKIRISTPKRIHMSLLLYLNSFLALFPMLSFWNQIMKRFLLQLGVFLLPPSFLLTSLLCWFFFELSKPKKWKSLNPNNPLLASEAELKSCLAKVAKELPRENYVLLGSVSFWTSWSTDDWLTLSWLYY